MIVWILVTVHLLKVNPHVEIMSVFSTKEACNIAVHSRKNKHGGFPINSTITCIKSKK